jgi:hypothetical protein
MLEGKQATQKLGMADVLDGNEGIGTADDGAKSEQEDLGERVNRARTRVVEVVESVGERELHRSREDGET